MTSQQKTHQAQKPSKPSQAQLPRHSRAGSFNPGQLHSASETLSSADMLSAQQKVGNDVVQRSLDATIQREGEEFKRLGAGTLNAVWKVARPQAGAQPASTGFFKPNKMEDDDKGNADPDMGARSVMSSAINDTLGHDVLAKETYRSYPAESLGLDGDEMIEGSESSEVPGTPLYKNAYQEVDKETYDSYLEMDPGRVKVSKRKKATGEPVYKKVADDPKFLQHDFGAPGVQKDMSNLQIQDAITGQHDRHGGNIRIDDTTGRAMGYDSDLMSSTKPQAQISANVPNLHKKNWLSRLFSRRTKQEDVDAASKKEARQKALTRMNMRHDKYVGLPTHLDHQTAKTLIDMKSSEFMKKLKADKANTKRLSPDHLREIQTRYQQVRRYAKAGVAANAPDMLSPEQLTKWGDAGYQDTVRKGMGDRGLPTIVREGGWNQETFHQQTSAVNSKSKSYLGRSAGQFAEGGLKLMAQQMMKKYMGSGVVQPSAEPDHRRSDVVEHAGQLPQQVSAAIQKQRGGGVALPENVQAEAQQILGHNFSDVRIHNGAEANRLSRSIQARAFTIGKDIFFKQGIYTPGSTAGRETLLHELTHVAQQTGSNSSGPLRLGAPDTPHEKQAEQISRGSSSSAAPSASQAGAVQRSYQEEKLAAPAGKTSTPARKKD